MGSYQRVFYCTSGPIGGCGRCRAEAGGLKRPRPAQAIALQSMWVPFREMPHDGMRAITVDELRRFDSQVLHFHQLIFSAFLKADSATRKRHSDELWKQHDIAGLVRVWQPEGALRADWGSAFRELGRACTRSSGRYFGCACLVIPTLLAAHSVSSRRFRMSRGKTGCRLFAGGVELAGDRSHFVATMMLFL